MIGPWLGHVFLAATAILGLFTASGAADDATYAVGLATFALAVVITAVRIRRQIDGRAIGFLLPVALSSSDELFITIAILAVLGLVGAILAAEIGGSVYGIGLALFVICYALILFEVKRFFDARERNP